MDVGQFACGALRWCGMAPIGAYSQMRIWFGEVTAKGGVEI